MGLKLPKDAEKKPTGLLYLEKEGIYKIRIIGNEDKEDEGEKSKRKGYHFHNLKIIFENEETTFARIYYQNKEGDIVPEGYNFILGLKKVVENAVKGDSRLLKKLEDADSNRIIGYLNKEKIEFYLATRNSIYNGVDVTNLNTYIDPMSTLEEAEAIAEERKLEIISLIEEEEEDNASSSKKDDDYDDDDDDL